jgi:RimK family alpha-L-glutamate ligase
MNIGILVQDLEDQEKEIQLELERKGISSEIIDVRKTNLEYLSKKDLILNRVFASVANRDYKDNLKTLDYLEKLEEKGTRCVNSFFTTLCDYNKYFSSKVMKDNGVINPETFLVQNESHLVKAKNFFKEYGEKRNQPVVFKRNMGGRGKEIFLISNKKELEKKVLESLSNKDYNAGYILQEFIKSDLPYDYRISVIGEKIVYSMTRSFIDSGDGNSWISSMTLGSKETLVDAPEKVKEAAIKATKSIGAFFNDVDIIVKDDVPYIIENNPTPNFAKRKEASKKKELVIKNLVEEIKNR